MTRDSAIVVDLSEYRRQRQEKTAAEDRAAPLATPVLWYWVWFFPVPGPALQAQA